MDVGTRLSLTLSLSVEIVRCSGVVATKYPQVGNASDLIVGRPIEIERYIAGGDVRVLELFTCFMCSASNIRSAEPSGLSAHSAAD
jgi:hypothetical protein